MKKAPAGDQKEYSIMLADEKNALSSIEKNRWMLSQETIDAYQMYAPDVCLTSDDTSAILFAQETDSIINRYLAGNIDWRQLAKALSERCAMIQAEQAAE